MDVINNDSRNIFKKRHAFYNIIIFEVDSPITVERQSSFFLLFHSFLTGYIKTSSSTDVNKS